MKSELFSYLPDIEFAEKDPQAIESEIITKYEELSGRTLARGDPVRLFLEGIALVIIQQRELIDRTGKMNLLAYASGDYLDHIGAMLGVSRLDPSHAVCTLRFVLSAELNFSVLIPKGTRVTPGDGIIFATTESGEIPAGERVCELTAMSQSAGDAGNGYIPGQIKRLIDPLPYEMSVMNITASTGGSDVENDENFRERIHIAPESFTSAGSKGAYEYYARSSHPDIISVSVIGPPYTQPGHVEIYPLMQGGELPSDEILQAVYETCNAEDVRPDTDYVDVKRAVSVKYEVEMRYWIDKKNASGAGEISERVKEAVKDWEKWQRLALGRDINPSELNYRVIKAGAKRCEIIKPEFRVLKANELGICSQESIMFGGIEEG